MPAYVSHTVMANEVYRKLDNHNVSKPYMITFSLGCDLSKYSKCRNDTHKIKQEEFILNIVKYMKENNLTNDKECLGLLYGHICHVVFDETVHPLVYSISKSLIKHKHNHTFIEGHYDYYLASKKLNIQINKLDNKRLFSGKVNKKISQLLDTVYDETYNTKNVSKNYCLNLYIYRGAKILYKLFSLKALKSLSGYNKFLKRNQNINFREDELNKLYDQSVNDAIIYINKINKKLYDKTS